MLLKSASDFYISIFKAINYNKKKGNLVGLYKMKLVSEIHGKFQSTTWIIDPLNI